MISSLNLFVFGYEEYEEKKARESKYNVKIERKKI